MKNLSVIEKLLDWKGGWAARALFDDAVSRHINHEKQDFQLAEAVVKKSSGISAIHQLRKYSKLTNLEIDISGISEALSPNIKQVINLVNVIDIPYEITADFWLEKLCDHLSTNRINLTSSIKQSLAEDGFPTGNPKSLIENWSFPIISSFLPLLNENKDVLYFEDEIAEICWKRWYLTPEKQPLLFETPSRTNLKNSQWLVWRLLHDATHLLHLQNYPDAGSYLDPNWLLTLEAAAMTSEYKFLKLIDYEENIPKPVDYSIDLFNLKTILLTGLLERSLRLDYDLAVHLNGKPIDEWIVQSRRKTGLELNYYGFAREFHGLPGFCAGYMLGLKALENEEDKLAVLRGEKLLDFISLENDDKLSRSPLTDVPSKLPQHSLYIQSVGTSETTCFLNLLNPFTNKIESINLKVHLTVDLKSSQRGIHMSRLQQILNELDMYNKWNSLSDVADFIAKEAKSVQGSERSEVILTTNSYVETFNNRSKTRSKQPIIMTASAFSFESKKVSTIGLTVKIMTACPCTILYSRLKTKENLKLSLKENYSNSILSNIPPTFTHSQAGTVSVKVSSESNLIPLKNLYNQISTVCHLVESVLKRPDEHYLVHKSHSKPQFCEDVCREVAVAVSSELNANDTTEVIVELDESIHPHKAFAKIVVKASDTWYAE
jgi:GTP cyclohydrolase FolE2